MTHSEVRFAGVGVVKDGTFYEIRVEPVNGAPALVNVWARQDSTEAQPIAGREALSRAEALRYLRETWGVQQVVTRGLLLAVGR